MQYILLGMIAMSCSLSFATSNNKLEIWFLKAEDECVTAISQATDKYNETCLNVQNKFTEMFSPAKTDKTLKKIIQPYKEEEVSNKREEIIAKLNKMRQEETDECNRMVAQAREKYIESFAKAKEEYRSRVMRLNRKNEDLMWKEKEEVNEYYPTMMLLFAVSLQADLSLRPATEASFDLKPKRQKKKEWLQTNKQKKNSKKWKQTKRPIHQPFKKH